MKRVMACGQWVYGISGVVSSSSESGIYVTSDRSSTYTKERFAYLQGRAYSTLGEVYDLPEIGIC